MKKTSLEMRQCSGNKVTSDSSDHLKKHRRSAHIKTELFVSFPGPCVCEHISTWFMEGLDAFRFFLNPTPS